jgi:predicted acylesterase/phospholipase RssA
LFGALSIADSTPLRTRLRGIVNDRMLAEIAAEHRQGRRLLVLTTNLEAARPVIWDMGRIAAAGDRELFVDVMLASASVPGAFPPVPIRVEIDGRQYDELHVDGGVTRSVVLGPTGMEDVLVKDMPFPIRRRIFVIQNNVLVPAYEPVERSLSGIASRSVSTLIRAQSEGDLTHIYLAAQRAGAEFYLAFVPQEFAGGSAASFDPEYMTALYEASRADARDGISWQRVPPGVAGRSLIERGEAN